ncbi:hypothetical protein CU100_15170 [Phyllobacterium endophyticum]|uniref:Uncharacterized protein n=1 Tax=Phyllobacterium endophyticum TaxID=1149773 RepID=A0A2P7AR37_9HYPH|nr:hypothetical protein CU100_15170 [Phyllobacterium endophyticum]
MSRRRVGVRLVPSVHDVRAFAGLLLDAIDHLEFSNTGRRQGGGYNVDHVLELPGDTTQIGNAAGHDIATPCAVPPKCGGTCFTHLNAVSIAQATEAPDLPTKPAREMT